MRDPKVCFRTPDTVIGCECYIYRLLVHWLYQADAAKDDQLDAFKE